MPECETGAQHFFVECDGNTIWEKFIETEFTEFKIKFNTDFENNLYTKKHD